MMRRTKQIGVIAMILLSASIICLAIVNDRRYNTERHNDASEKAMAERSVRNQSDSLSTKLQEITVRLDSINGVLKDTKETENRNMESVNQSLGRIEKTGNQIFKAVR